MRKSSELTFKGPEVCRDSGGAETVIQNGVYNGIIALNVIVDGERGSAALACDDVRRRLDGCPQSRTGFGTLRQDIL